MSRLIPERRVNKNGVAVTKHVRAEGGVRAASFLARIVPSIAESQRAAAEAAAIAAAEAARRKEMLSFLNDAMRREEIEKEQELDVKINSETDPAERNRLVSSRSLLMRIKFSNYDPVDDQLSKVAGYSTDTIERIYSAAQSAPRVTDLISDGPENETIRRAALNFPEHSIHALYADRMFEDIAVSTGVDDLSSLPPGSDAHGLVDAVVEVAVRAHEDRAKAHYAEADKKQLRSNSWIRDEQARTQMTRTLASVIVENPTRVDYIVEYMRSRKLDPAEVDGGHLEVYLNDVSARSLADGAL